VATEKSEIEGKVVGKVRTRQQAKLGAKPKVKSSRSGKSARAEKRKPREPKVGKKSSRGDSLMEESKS